MKEREISLLNLLVEILLRWRAIIVWMLVGGIVMGAFGYVNSYKTEQTQLAAKVAQEQALREKKAKLEAAQVEDVESALAEEILLAKLTKTQINNVNVAVNYEKYASECQRYLDNSLLMQIDPQKVPQTKIIFTVAAMDEEQTTNIVSVYKDMISNGLLEWLEKEAGAEYTTTNYSEVISLDACSYYWEGTNALFSVGLLSEAERNSFSIKVLHVTKEKSMALADLIVRYINEQEDSLKEQLGVHTIEVADQSFAYVMDTKLLDVQRDYFDEIANSVASAKKLKAEFDEHEIKYFEFLMRNYDEKQNEAIINAEIAVTVQPEKVSMIYIALGMVLFAIVYVFYVFMKYISNTKLRVTDDIKGMFCVTQLGVIPPNTEKSRIFSFVDKWILKIRNYNKRVFTEEEAIGLVTVAVKMAAKKEGVNAVYCIGCNMQERAKKIAEQMGDILGEENISLTLLNNVLYNQETMAQLSEAKAVVLLEKAGETLYDEIAKELELLQRQGITVLGAITVE